MNEYKPTPPPNKSAEWIAHWEDVVTRLSGLETIDEIALRLLVDSMVEVDRQRAMIAQEGDTYITPTGSRNANPRHKIIEANQQRIYRLLCQFKGTPAARRNYGSANTVAAKNPNDPMDEFE